MSRPSCVRILALGFTAALVSSCIGGPPPRRAATNAPPRAEPVRSATAIPGNPPPPVAGESAIVVDVASGRVLYAKNADMPRAVASTQKIITALCVLDAGNIDRSVTIQPVDEACEPTKLFMKPGEQYTRRDLLRVLMVKSANDVARALARDVGGNVDGFSDLMNRKAASLGMRNSHFVTPNGLPAPGQYSTARDMAIAARAAYRSPLLRSFTGLRKYTFVYNDGRTRVLENTNRLLKTVPFCDGMKTGTTNAAGRCLVATGSLGGRSVITVVLKSNTAHVWSDSERLLRWGLGAN